MRSGCRFIVRAIRDDTCSGKNLCLLFGTDGVLDISLPGVHRFLAVDNSGVYVLSDPVPASLSGLELRILNGSDGTAVGSFGSGGVVSIRDYSIVRAMTIDSSAVFIAAQTPASPSGSQWHIEKRSTSDGSLVAAFGSSGVIVGTFVGLPFGIVVDATAVYIAGYEVVAGPSGNNTAWRIEKRDITDGTPLF